MSVFDLPDFDDHARVCFFNDGPSGLRAIIAIHRLRGGVSGGGIRMWPYGSDGEALTDALRLSRAMSYKFALAGIPYGGAKSVIIGDSRVDKSDALLTAFGRAIDSLGGACLCGPDVGTSAGDMTVIARETEYVRGREGLSGDTSPATAYGIWQALRAAVRHRLGKDDLAGLTVAVQGLGAVGGKLCRHLVEAGARLIVADIDDDAVARTVRELGAEGAEAAEVVDAADILFAEADILAPCALGAVFDDATIPRLKAGIVCGGANNQLAEERHGAALDEAGVLYVPDFVANAGGTIHAVREDPENPDFDEDAAMAAVAGIYDTCAEIFSRAEGEGVPTSVAADRLARKIIGDWKTP